MLDEEMRFPILTVDGIIFQMIDGGLHVLLIQRAFEPFLGKWALPGGYNPAGETTTQALERVLVSKTGIMTSQLGYMEQLCTIDTVARDPRGHAISVVYVGLGRNLAPGGEGAQNPQFFPINKLPELAYDHDQLIAWAVDRLREKLVYTNITVALLPPTFTLTELQTVYEAILGRKLDKRNFRKKIAALNIITSTGEYEEKAAHRPAQLYRFTNTGSSTPAAAF